MQTGRHSVRACVRACGRAQPHHALAIVVEEEAYPRSVYSNERYEPEHEPIYVDPQRPILRPVWIPCDPPYPRLSKYSPKQQANWLLPVNVQINGTPDVGAQARSRQAPPS